MFKFTCVHCPLPTCPKSRSSKPSDDPRLLGLLHVFQRPLVVAVTVFSSSLPPSSPSLLSFSVSLSVLLHLPSVLSFSLSSSLVLHYHLSFKLPPLCFFIPFFQCFFSASRSPSSSLFLLSPVLTILSSVHISRHTDTHQLNKKNRKV